MALRTRPIARLDLKSFPRPEISRQRSATVRASWYLVNTLFFGSSLLSLVPSRTKAFLLRIYGAQVGRGVVIKPRVNIKYPWFLDIGDHVWIGERVWIDNHTTVRIGSNSCISQGAYLFTGNHDWNDPSFAFFCKPIEIGEGVWITAFCIVGPGSVIPDSVAVLRD